MIFQMTGKRLKNKPSEHKFSMDKFDKDFLSLNMDIANAMSYT